MQIREKRAKYFKGKREQEKNTATTNKKRGCR